MMVEFRNKHFPLFFFLQTYLLQTVCAESLFVFTNQQRCSTHFTHFGAVTASVLFSLTNKNWHYESNMLSSSVWYLNHTETVLSQWPMVVSDAVTIFLPYFLCVIAHEGMWVWEKGRWENVTNYISTESVISTQWLGFQPGPESELT